MAENQECGPAGGVLSSGADACPRCGKPVNCGMASGKCWCTEFPPALALPQPDSGAGCYCRDCLKEIIAGMTPPPSEA